jgi:predicted Zn finger-like uncharacterized protein
MIVDCPSCGATYNISDEKVRGRRVRVRCKNCSGPIIVDGEQIDADDATRVYQPSFDPNTVEDTRVYKPQLEPNTYEDTDESTRVMTVGGSQSDHPAPGAWTVNVSATDQRTMTLEEIVDTYNSGFITEEAFVWRDGMSDWLPLMEVEEIQSAIESNQATHVVKPAVMRAQARRSAVNPPTPISYSAPAAAPPRARIAAAPASSVEYAPPHRELPSSPEPARLRGGRSGGQDLFGGIASAGSEQELFGSSSMPAQDTRERPTGARNESSILFSLNAVRAGVGPTSAPPRGLGATPPPPTAAEILGMDASGGLPGVDMNAVLATAPVPEPPPERITRPPARARMDTLPPTGKRRARPLMIAAVVFVAAAMLAGLAYVIRARQTEPARVASPAVVEPTRTAEPVATAQPTTPPPASAAEPSPSAAAPPKNAAPSEPASPPAAAPAPAPAPPAPQPAVPVAPAPAPKGGLARPAPQPRPGGAKPEGAGKGDQKIVLEEEHSEAPAPAPEPKAAPKEEAPTEAPPDPERPPFDMSAAKAALEGAASSAGSCKSADGPTGRGKVQVTFSPSGRVTSANVVEGAFGGTPVGGCIAKLFRSAKVPAFSGDPVTVAKAFTIPE